MSKELQDEIEALKNTIASMQEQIDGYLHFGKIMGGVVHNHILAMGAAVIAGHLESPAVGMQWIVNTLEGPGNLPDLDEAQRLGGAQAWFDAETAKEERRQAELAGKGALQ